MRITLLTPDPAPARAPTSGWLVSTDVEVPAGARLGDLRADLARITGHRGWASPGNRLAVEHVAVDDEHPCGQPPLLAGARLRIGRGSRPADDEAIDAHRHVAVVEGPDCGALRAVGGSLLVGRSTPRPLTAPGAIDEAAAARLGLRDPSMSVRHVELRMRRGEVVARDAGSTNGTRLVRGERRRAVPWRRHGRAVRRSWVRLRPGDQVRAGATILEVRGPASDPAPTPPRREPTPGPASSLGSTLLTWLAPAAGTVALAAATGNRLLLVCVLIAPALALGQVVVERRRNPRPGSAVGPGDRRGARSGRRSAAGRSAEPVEDVACLVDEVRPGDLATASLVRLRRGAAHPDGEPAGHGPGPENERREAAGAAETGAGRAVAVVGPRTLTLGIARAITLGLVGPAGSTALVVRCADRDSESWRWARWLTPRSAPLPGPATGRTVVVADGQGTHAEIARWWHGSGGTHHLVLVTRSTGAVPAWCDTVVEVGTNGTVLRRGGRSRPLPLRAVGVDWAEQQSRRAAAARALDRAGDRGPVALPDHVALGDLPGVGPPDDEVVRARWAAHPPTGLLATLGADEQGAVSVDLVRDGPHALVAGTTGAGKSALLQTLVLSLALGYPPTRLAIALVDYKGGASFGACADLPHVVGQVTDLDGSLATRALAGLRAELDRRERTLAAAGCTDLAALWLAHDAGATTVAPPPRLLVVVDEFRAMADEHPDFLPGLLRLAAQGRSLGMHLVLATQRPAGAIGPDLRANISLRIALRVTDAAESVDVLEVPDAASILPSTPGRAIVRRGTAAPEWVQVAQVLAPGRRSAADLAVPWTGADATWVPGAGRDARPRAAARTAPLRPEVAAPAADDARRYVDSVRRAAGGMPLPTPPWLAALPDLVDVGELAGLPRERGDDAGCSIPLALGDLPHDQRRTAVRWDPAAGHLLVLGGPGSGRTTALRTVTAGALGLGLHVHLVGLDLAPAASTDLVSADEDLDHRGTSLGTFVGCDDPRRLARLVAILAEVDDARPPCLLVVDDLEAALDALAAVARGVAGERLLDLLRDGRRRGVTVVAGARASARTLTHAPLFSSRLVLGQTDAVADVLAGIPAELAGGRRPPGRAVHLTGDGAVECQVALASERSVRGPGGRRAGGRASETPRPAPGGTGREPLRLRAIPAHVPWARVGTAAVVTGGAPGPAVGLGGDDAGILHLDTSRGALVVGSPGSGRSNALQAVTRGLVLSGRRVAVVAPDGPLREVAGLRWSVGHEGLRGLLDELEACAEPVDLVVDDLDDLDQARPLDVELLARLVGPDATRDVRLVASSRTARAATAYREPFTRLRSGRRGIVLDPYEPGSADVFGRSLDWVLDPARPHARGRGVLHDDRQVVTIQVADTAGSS